MKTFLALSLSDVVFIMLINIKMPTIGILTFKNMINFMLSSFEHEKKFYNLGAWFQSEVFVFLYIFIKIQTDLKPAVTE